MQRHVSLAARWMYMGVTLLTIAGCLLAVSGMLLASVAFTDGTNIEIPHVATFDGVRESSGLPSVTIAGSPVGLGVATLVITAMLGAVARRFCWGSARARRPSSRG